MKPHQKINRDLGIDRVVLGEGRANRRPVLSRNPLALTPFLDSPERLADGLSKIYGPAERLKQGGDVSDVSVLLGLHSPKIASDNESGQCRTNWALTSDGAERTMCPMGKATTPARFRKDFCRRVKAARVLRGLNQPEAAHLLGVKEDTYSKYERRTAMPHYLIPKACHLFEVTPDELYGLVDRPELDRDYEEIKRAG